MLEWFTIWRLWCPWPLWCDARANVILWTNLYSHWFSFGMCVCVCLGHKRTWSDCESSTKSLWLASEVESCCFKTETCFLMDSTVCSTDSCKWDVNLLWVAVFVHTSTCTCTYIRWNNNGALVSAGIKFTLALGSSEESVLMLRHFDLSAQWVLHVGNQRIRGPYPRQVGVWWGNRD